MNSLCAVIAAWLNDVSQRSNKIAIQATAQMAADKAAIGLSGVHIRTYVYPALRDNCILCLCMNNTGPPGGEV